MSKGIGRKGREEFSWTVRSWKGVACERPQVWLEADRSIGGKKRDLRGSGSHGRLVSRSRASPSSFHKEFSGSNKSTDPWEGGRACRHLSETW